MMSSKLSIAALAAAVALLAPCTKAAPTSMMSALKRDDSLRFGFGSTKVRGVNLGGWFVLEPWITPSIFEKTPDNVVDEWTMGQTLGKSATESLMQAHWSSWITADDFQQMAGYGINIVRIPIGYWSVLPIAGDPYVQGAYAWLGKAIGWAGDNGIKVLIDLHGAPGSQNGLDNSGHKGPIEWLTQAGSYQHTIATLNKIRNDYASNPAVAAIELVNEPEGPDLNMDTVRQFYMDGWGNLKNSHVGIVFHDAFEGVTSWNDWGSGMWNLIEDTHHYEVFDSTSLQNTTQQHVTTACGFGGQMASNNKVTIAGEWSGAMTDCAQWLNGRGIGARYDGTYDVDGTGSSYIGSCEGFYSGTVSGLSSQAKDNIGQFINAQIAAFEQAGGWIFWTWHTEAAPEWDFKALSEAGVFPKLGSVDTSICS